MFDFTYFGYAYQDIQPQKRYSVEQLYKPDLKVGNMKIV